MIHPVRSTVRCLAAPALAALALTTPGAAQLPLNAIVVSTQMGTPAAYGFRVITGPGASYPLTNLPATVAQSALTAFEVDPVSGDILYGAEDAAGVHLRRLRVFGPTVVSDTLLHSIPNTAGYRAGYLHREPTGGYLLLSRPTISGAGPQLLHRIGVTSQSAISYLVQQIAGGPSFTDMTVNPLNQQIMLTGPQGSPQSRVATLSFDGGTWNPVAFLFQFVNPWALEVTAAGQPVVAGNHFTQANVSVAQCSGAFAATPIATGQTCVDMHAERLTNTVLACFNGGTATVDRFSLSCSPTWQQELYRATLGTALFKVSSYVPAPEYGYPRETTAGFVPSATVPVPPVVGGNWTVQATNLIGGSVIPAAIFAMGFNDVSSGAVVLPVDLTPIGFTRCALFCSGEATATQAVTNGAAQNVVPIPNDIAFRGLRLFGQWAAMDGATFVQTNAVVSTIL